MPTNNGRSATGPVTINYTSDGNPLYVLLTWFVSGGAIDATDAVSGVTFNGQALTRGGQAALPGNTMEWWRLASHTPATADVVITMASARSISAGVINLSGWPAAIVDHNFVARGNLESLEDPNVTVPSSVGAQVVDWLGFNNPASDVTVDASQTQAWNQEIATTPGAIGDQLSAGSTKAGAATSVTMSWAMTILDTLFNEYWGHAALSFGGTVQRATQLVALVGTDEYADDDPPPDVTQCSGSGTVASGTNPGAGTALAAMTRPIVWVEVVAGGTTYRWSKVAFNDSTRKEPRIKRFGRLVRALSDPSGYFETPVLSLRLIDTDRVLRGLMNSAVLINQPISVYVMDQTTSASNARRVFHGTIRTFRPLSQLEFEIIAEDRFTMATSAFAMEKLVPARLITSQISDQNPTDRVLDKPVPIIYGACSDEDDDDPVGVVPLIYIGSETPDDWDDNLHKFLVCGHALKNVQSVFLADYTGGALNPTTRIKAPASAYGDVLFSPHQDGWFGSDEFTDQADERYTYIYGLDGHTAIELARTGRIPLTVNVCGIESTGDATGTMLSNPARCFLHALNNWIAQQATANWLSILSLGSYTLFDTTTFETVATICSNRGYECAGILGADYEQQNWRDVVADFCRNFDFDIGVNRHGQIMLTMLDLTDTYSSATTFTDQNHVLRDSLEIDPQTDVIENEVQYVYKRNYVEALHAVNTAEGSRPNRDPYDGKWFSGLQRVSDEDVITDMGGRPLGLRQSKVQEYNLVRDQDTADDVAARRLARRRYVRSLATFTVTLSDGDGVELGDVIKLTHFQGVTSTGWSSRRLQVRRIEDDLDAFTRTISALDVDDLLEELTFSGEGVTFDGEPVTFTYA